MLQSFTPTSNLLKIQQQGEMSSKAFGIDFVNGKLIGFIDGKTAIEQSIYLALSTDRYAHLIFSWNYGDEIQKLIGKPKDFARAELPRLITECLLMDDRISAIEDIVITDIEEGLAVAFTAVTTQGEIAIAKEVWL